SPLAGVVCGGGPPRLCATAGVVESVSSSNKPIACFLIKSPTHQPTNSLTHQLTNSPISLSYSSSGAPPPALPTSSCLTRSTLNFCALPMILSRASSKSNDVAFENLV